MKLGFGLSFATVIIFVVGLLIGGVGFGSFVQHTSTVDFCTSCHEMRNTVYEEYKKSVHFNNAHGVRASCSDCHIPHDWSKTLARKVLAVKDVYHHLVGTIDTPEKFEAKRLELAQKVWARMKADDSRECRNCHSFDAMEFDDQRPRAKKQHENAQRDNMTCIDCHKGIAHKPVHNQIKKDESKEDFSLQF